MEDVTPLLTLALLGVSGLCTSLSSAQAGSSQGPGVWASQRILSKERSCSLQSRPHADSSKPQEGPLPASSQLFL